MQDVFLIKRRAPPAQRNLRFTSSSFPYCQSGEKNQTTPCSSQLPGRRLAHRWFNLRRQWMRADWRLPTPVCSRLSGNMEEEKGTELYLSEMGITLGITHGYNPPPPTPCSYQRLCRCSQLTSEPAVCSSCFFLDDFSILNFFFLYITNSLLKNMHIFLHSQSINH